MFVSFTREMVIYYLFVLLALIPVARIFMRAGFKPYWVAMLLVPDVGLALCAATLVVKKWRREERV